MFGLFFYFFVGGGGDSRSQIHRFGHLNTTEVLYVLYDFKDLLSKNCS